MYCSWLRIQFTSSTHIKPSQMAFGRTINILYLLTYLLVQVLLQWTGKTFQCICTSFKTMAYAGQYTWHAHLLEIHSQALKHDVDIPDNLGADQAVGGGRQWKRYRLAVLSCSLWLLYCLNQRLAQAGIVNSNTLMMLPRWLMKGCMGQRFCNAVVWIAELVRVKKVGN